MNPLKYRRSVKPDKPDPSEVDKLEFTRYLAGRTWCEPDLPEW